MLKISCYKIKTQSLKWTNSPRQNQMGKKEKFCLQITTAQIGLTTQERQNQMSRVTKPDEKLRKYWFFHYWDKTGNKGLISQEYG